MNRIRKIDNNYQVLITPDIKLSPDSSLLIGNWEDESLRNYYILQFESLNDAQAEAYNYPDIDWYRISLSQIGKLGGILLTHFIFYFLFLFFSSFLFCSVSY